MDAVASDDVLDEAYAWLCRRRREAPFWHDVWHLRWTWDDLGPRLRDQLLDGTFRLEPTRTVRLDEGTVEVWSSRDALVLKAVSLVLGRHLPNRLADGCYNAPLFIARYMDDWVVLAPTRWTLRRAVRRIRQIVAALGMELAPEKTFVGRVDRGFEFLGYRSGPSRLVHHSRKGRDLA